MRTACVAFFGMLRPDVIVLGPRHDPGKEAFRTTFWQRGPYTFTLVAMWWRRCFILLPDSLGPLQNGEADGVPWE